MPTFDLENQLRQELGNPELPVAGLDEVGTGAIAGPVVVAAVVFSRTDFLWQVLIDDSKKLSKKKRNLVYSKLIEASANHLVTIGLGMSSNAEIDRVGIYPARLKAMEEAIKQLQSWPIGLILDGKGSWGGYCGAPELCVPKADGLSYSVAAASIIAKVSRDTIMENFGHYHYEQYGFGRNKGYPSPAHLEALVRYGPSPSHRLSFAPCKEVS